MKYIVPDYYGEFSCIKGACRHSCCIGWEIDIDADSLQAYRSLEGEISRRLAENIIEDEDGAHFRLGAEERCPFLNRDGLCDLILELGEDALCQICADHPRFRNFFSDREETGLGLCCEAAARLILTHQKPASLKIAFQDDADEAPDPFEAELLELRSGLIERMQNRSLPTEKRVRRITEKHCPALLQADMRACARFFITLERLDEAWTGQLEALQNADPGELLLPYREDLEIALEQLMVYLLYRHLPAALEDGEPELHIACCVLIWQLMRALFALNLNRQSKMTIEHMVQLCRLYSSEIEYSDENIEAILHFLSNEMQFPPSNLA